MSDVVATETPEADPTPTIEPAVLVEPSVVPETSVVAEVPPYPRRLAVGWNLLFGALVLAALIGMLAGFGVAFLVTLPRLRHHSEA